MTSRDALFVTLPRRTIYRPGYIFGMCAQSGPRNPGTTVEDREAKSPVRSVDRKCLVCLTLGLLKHFLLLETFAIHGELLKQEGK